MRLPGLFTHRAFGPAFRWTVGLWAFGYILLELLMIATGRWGQGASLVTGAIQFTASIGLATLLLAVVLALDAMPLVKRVVGIASMFVGVVAVQGFVDLTSNWMIAELIEDGMAWATFDLTRYLRVSFIYVWVFALNLVLIYISMYHSRVRDQQLELAETKAQVVQAQLAMLRYQLNPHFLFNTLNAISDRHRVRRAQRYRAPPGRGLSPRQVRPDPVPEGRLDQPHQSRCGRRATDDRGRSDQMGTCPVRRSHPHGPLTGPDDGARSAEGRQNDQIRHARGLAEGAERRLWHGRLRLGPPGRDPDLA